jgi:hypothetical protein
VSHELSRLIRSCRCGAVDLWGDRLNCDSRRARRSQRRARISSIMAREVLVELGLVRTPRRPLPEFPVMVADSRPGPGVSLRRSMSVNSGRRHRSWGAVAEGDRGVRLCWAEALNAATACGWPIGCAITSCSTIPTASAARSMPAVIIPSRQRAPPDSRSGPVPAHQWSHVLVSGVPAWSPTGGGLAGHGTRRVG